MKNKLDEILAKLEIIEIRAAISINLLKFIEAQESLNLDENKEIKEILELATQNVEEIANIIDYD